MDKVSIDQVTRWTWIALALPLLALAPLLYMQSRVLMLKPHLQFFPIAILAAIYFLNSEATGSHSAKSTERVWGVPCWIAVVLIAIASLYLGSPWLAHFCAIAFVFTWGLIARPQITTLRLAGIAGLLLVTLPPPFGWDKQLVGGLQSLSSICCSRLMDLTQIIHVRRGNVIEISSKPLFVEEACSGVDSQYALMAVAGVLLLLGRAGVWVTLITVVTVPIWAILGNLLRIYLIVIGLEWIGLDLSKGTIHMILGLGVFVFTAWVHWSSVQLLNYFQATYWQSNLHHSEAVTADAPPALKSPGFLRLGYPWVAIPLVLFLFFPESIRAVSEFHSKPDLPSIRAEDSERFPGMKDLLPGGGARLVGFHTESRDRNDMLGQHSRIWDLQWELGNMTVCLDFPFRGWHPLWECYINSGWQRENSQLVTDDQGESFYETKLRNDLGDIAILHFSLFDQNGQPYTYEGSFEYRSKANRWTTTLFNRKRPSDPILEPITFQFQQIAYTSFEPHQEQLAKLRKIFISNRRQVQSKSSDALRILQSD